MKVEVLKVRPDRFPENEVKNHLTVTPYRSKTLAYDPDGLFSDIIFGTIDRCRCGELRKPGFCKLCNTRVVDINNLPNYWFDLGMGILDFHPMWNELREEMSKNIDMTKQEINTRVENAQSVLQYEKFVYIDEKLDGDFDISVEKLPIADDDFDVNRFEQNNIYIGKDGAKLLGVSDTWLENNLTDTLYIPHPIYRPLIKGNDGKAMITDLNQRYQDLIIKANNVKDLLKYSSSKLHNLVSYNKVSELFKDVNARLVEELQSSRFSVLRSEIISHPISGASRSTLLNRHDLNEDVLLIGDEFIRFLYPYLFKKHRGDMYKINKELIDKDYVMILNRPPSISYMSIMGMKPRIASLYPLGHTEGTNGGLLSNDEYVFNSGLYCPGLSSVQGDIEKFSPQYIGRKNYNNVPNTEYRQHKMDYTVRTPFELVKPHRRDIKNKINSDISKNLVNYRKHYEQEIVEEFLNKYGIFSNDVQENTPFELEEILDKTKSYSPKEVKTIENSSDVKRKNNDLLIQNFMNIFDEAVVSNKKVELTKTEHKKLVEAIAKALVMSKQINYRTLKVTTIKNGKNAYGFKVKDVENWVRQSHMGINPILSQTMKDMNVLTDSFTFVTTDLSNNRDVFDYREVERLFKECVTDGKVNHEDLFKEVKEIIKLDNILTEGIYDTIIFEYEEENKTITKDEIDALHSLKIEAVAKEVTRAFKNGIVIYSRMMNLLQLKVVKDLKDESNIWNTELLPIMDIVKLNSDKIGLMEERFSLKLNKLLTKQEELNTKTRYARNIYRAFERLRDMDGGTLKDIEEITALQNLTDGIIGGVLHEDLVVMSAREAKRQIDEFTNLRAENIIQINKLKNEFQLNLERGGDAIVTNKYRISQVYSDKKTNKKANVNPSEEMNYKREVSCIENINEISKAYTYNEIAETEYKKNADMLGTSIKEEDMELIRKYHEGMLGANDDVEDAIESDKLKYAEKHSSIGMAWKASPLKQIVADGVEMLGTRGQSVSLISSDGMASDVDGDTLLNISLYGQASMEEAREMLSSHRFMNYSNGTIRNAIVEDFFYGVKDSEVEKKASELEKEELADNK